MNNLWLLIKVQIQSLLLRQSAKKNRKKALTGITTLLLLGGIFMYMAVTYVTTMVFAFPEGTQHVALYVMGMMTAFMLLIFGYQSAGGHLFGFKDYDLLMSLPVKKSEVLLSKFLSFLFLEYFYGFFLLAPSIIIVGIACHYNFLYYLLGIIAWMLAPVVPMVIASLLAYCSMYLAGKFKYKNLMNNLFYILLMAVMFVLIFYYQSLMNKTAGELLGIITAINTYMPFIGYLFNGMVDGNILQFGIGIFMNVITLVLFIWLFSKQFARLNGQIGTGYKMKDFKLVKSKGHSSFTALLQKEIRMYFSNTVYFMNTAIMPILMVIGFGYLCFFMRDEIQLLMSQFYGLVLPIFSGGLLLLSLMTCTTNASISLEGENFDVLKSYPVTEKEIFNAKIALNLLVILPCALISIVLAFITFHMSITDVLLCILTVLTSSYFISAFGLALNLNYYRLDWDNAAVVVKQSMPVFITIMGGMVVGGGVIFANMFLTQYLSSDWIVLLLNGILFALDLILYFYLKTKGVKQFHKIH